MMQRLILTGLVALSALLAPLSVLAQDEETANVDARLQGYRESVTASSGAAVTWLVFILLAAICLGVLFKDAQRTHLD